MQLNIKQPYRNNYSCLQSRNLKYELFGKFYNEKCDKT